MVQLKVYTQTLVLASLCLLLPQCIAEKLNAFDMRVFSTSMRDISEKVNRMESLLTNTSKEIVERFERTQSDVDGKLVSTNKGLKQLENTVLATVSSLESSVSAAREDLNTNKRQWEEGLTKMSIIESSLNATGQGLEGNKRDLTNLLATVSSMQTSISTTRDELTINQRDWHDGLARISFIESSVNATRNGMDDNKKDLANVLSTMIAIQSSITAAREELTDNKRNWDNAMASIQSVQSAVSTTRDEVAVNKKDLNDVVSSIASLQSSVSSTRDDVATNKRDMNNAVASLASMRSSISAAQDELTSTKKEWSNDLGRLPSIESSLSATRTEVAEIKETFGRGNQCMFTGSTDIRSTSSSQQDIAFGKPTYASPHYSDMTYHSSKAVDNDRNSFYNSELFWNSWWLVDFGLQYSIKEIFIQPRFEAVVERFHDVEIRLGNDLVQNGDFSSYKLLFFYRGPYTVHEGVLKCSFRDGISGRYLSIQIKNKKQFLQLNTVKVFA